MSNNLNLTASTVEAPPSLVVNEQRLPQTIKRFFKNSVREIFGEILQNAQRAQAKSVNIKTHGNIVTVTDDGEGLEENVEAWAKLLRISDSFYPDAAVEINQQPMGLGFLSLLAHEQVLRVKIASGNRQVVIDTDRLWNEPNYWQTWTALIQPTTVFVKGFHLDIITKNGAEFIKELKRAFALKTTYVGDYGVAEGYDEILRVYVDGVPAATAVPSDYKIVEKNFLFQTKYEGNTVEVGLDTGIYQKQKKNGVVWYGQVIPFLDNFPFHFLLKVVTGCPVNPLAPTRAGIIDDEKAAKFKAFLIDEIYRYAKSPEGRAQLGLKMAKSLFEMDTKRTIRELDICIIRKIVNEDLSEMTEYTQLLGEAHTSIHCSNPDHEEVLTLAELREETGKGNVVLVNQVILIEEEESVRFGEDATGSRELCAADYGLASFEASVKDTLSGEGELFFFVQGDMAQADVKTVVWRPGEVDNDQPIFVKPGEFALVSQAAVPEQGGVIVEIDGKRVVPGAGIEATAEMFDLNSADWHPVTKPVWAYNYPDNWSVASTDGLIVGVEGGKSEQANWVKDYAWTCFDKHHDDESEETLEEHFRSSITDFVIRILGDTLKSDFTFNDVCHAVYAKRGDQKSDFRAVQRNIEAIVPVIPEGELDWRLEVRMKSGETHAFSLYQ